MQVLGTERGNAFVLYMDILWQFTVDISATGLYFHHSPLPPCYMDIMPEYYLTQDLYQPISERMMGEKWVRSSP